MSNVQKVGQSQVAGSDLIFALNATPSSCKHQKLFGSSSGQGTYLRLPLAQDRFWRTTLCLSIHVLRNVCETACMIDPVTNLLGIHPYKLLCLIKPFHLEFLLADGTWDSSKRWIIRSRDELQFGILCCCCTGRILRRIYRGSRFALDFTRSDPILECI